MALGVSFVGGGQPPRRVFLSGHAPGQPCRPFVATSSPRRGRRQRFGVAEPWPLMFYFVVPYLGTALVALGVIHAGPGLVRRVI